MKETDEKKKGSKKIIVVVIIILLLLIVVGVSITIWKYNQIQEEKYQIAVRTVDEVGIDNLVVEYNQECTNEDITLTLNPASEYTLTYRIDKVSENDEEDKALEYVKYEKPILITENSKIYLKYLNAYGTYSETEFAIEIKNIDKEKPSITKKEATATTNEIKVIVEANDNVEVSKIETSIDYENYAQITENTHIFKNLSEDTEYTVYIKVIDTAGNITEDEIKVKTEVTPKTATNTTTNTKKPTTNTSTNKNNSTSNNTSSENKTLTKAQKEAEARKIAKQIANRCTGSTDLERVSKASSEVYKYYARGVHKETGDDYYTAYGVFILGESSCAGCCRALGMVLSEMGYSWKHINENQWTHQWLELKMDGKNGWADANIGLAGYN